MGANKPTVWNRGGEVGQVTVVRTEEGDGLKSARELRDYYLEKENWVERFKPGAGTYYRNAADALTKLIGDAYTNTLTVTLTLAVPA